MDEAAADAFARSWYDAWNSNDVERILGLYADDVELTSPLVSALTGRTDGKLVGKAALRHYVSANGQLAAEVVFLNAEGKISRYSAHYAGG